MTRRKFLDFFVDQGQNLLSFEAVLAAFDARVVVRGFEGFERVEVVVVGVVQRREERDPRVADLLPAEPVVDRVLQDPLKSSGSSAAGRSPYFSASLIIASCTMSSDASSSRTAYAACLNARLSTPARKSASSLSDAIP
ncbi:hypothetical protein C7S13_2116 [Burkholderia cepacia]|nr:hypothetical protein [Burkholderia cepacia]